MLKFLESKLHIPYVNLEDYSPDPKCFNFITFADARRYRIIPLFKIEDVLTVAMADPLDLFAIDKIIETAECSIEPVIASEISITKKSMNIIKLQILLITLPYQQTLKNLTGQKNFTRKTPEKNISKKL